uniref:Gustatory receptor n=1 Tax=Lutzomyia longipalpis TaxID=7200 RepID=A0A3F2ZDH1_LUTLO
METVVAKKVEDIYSVVYPFHIISKLLGLSPYPLRSPKSRKLFVKSLLLNLFYLFLILTLELVMMFNFFSSRDEYLIYTNSTIIDVTSQVLMIVVLINYFVSLGMNCLFQRRTQNLLADVASSDLLMTKIGIAINHSSHRRFVLTYLMGTFIQALIVVTISQSVLNYVNFELLEIEVIIAYIVSTVSYTTFLGHMLLALVGIHARFRLLNEFFEKNFICYQTVCSYTENFIVFGPTSGLTNDNQAKLVKHVTSAHDKLNDIVAQINSCYAFQIMMNMISWFIYTIYGTFNFYRLILINFKGYELLGYANMMWIVYHAMYLSAVVIFSSLIKAEGKKTSILLHQAINLEWNSKIVREMRIFSQQLGHRQPIVTCGLFPFDWSLFYSSIGLCVTYLTIMIQLDSSYSNPQLNVTLPAT